MASYYIEVTLILRHQQFLVARTFSCLVSVAAMSTHYGHLLGQKVLYSAPKSSEVLQAYLFLLYLILRSHFPWEIWIKVSLGFAGGFRFYVKNTHWIYIYIYMHTGSSHEIWHKNCRLPVYHICTYKNYSIKKPNLQTLTLKTKGQNILEFFNFGNMQKVKRQRFFDFSVFFRFFDPKKFSDLDFSTFRSRKTVFSSYRPRFSEKSLQPNVDPRINWLILFPIGWIETAKQMLVLRTPFLPGPDWHRGWNPGKWRYFSWGWGVCMRPPQRDDEK